MPMSRDFEDRLFPVLPEIINYFGTPFHIYDEQGIVDTAVKWKEDFKDVAGFQEYFAVKALPNPAILRIMCELGFGLDCSSASESLISVLSHNNSECDISSGDSARKIECRWLFISSAYLLLGDSR